MWIFVPDSSFFAFHGGFLLAATATCMIIACAICAPRSALSNFLSLGPARYLGAISYGMYLWYWPVVLVMSPARAHATGYELYAMRLAADVALAALCAHLIEIPIRRAAVTWRWSLAAPVAASVAMFSVFAATVAPATAGALPATTAAHLSVSGADHGAAPVKVLLLGDSMAGSLGVGLSEMAPRYDAEVANEGNPGCSLSMDDEIRALVYAAPPGPPCRPGDPQALLDIWKKWVDAWNPDVVLYIARGEVLDQVIGSSSSWVHIGEPTFDSRLESRYQQALRILGSRGARVYLLGSPLYHSGAEPLGDSSPWQEDDPARVEEDDTLMQAAVLDDPDGSGYLDVGAWVTPDSSYSAEQDGVDLRCADGVHFTAAGGRWVAQKLFPLVIAAARAHQSQAPGGAWPGSAPPPIPSWYASLQC
jgi:hypothetical protein